MEKEKIKTEPKEIAAPKMSLYQRMLDDQRAVDRYFRGEETLEQIHARGIKFVKPI